MAKILPFTQVKKNMIKTIKEKDRERKKEKADTDKETQRHKVK